MVERIKQNIIAGTEYGTQGPEYGVFKKIGLGTASGLLKIPEAILELGAGFSDYAFNTELVKALEEHYPRINVDDGVGKFVEIIVQYGIPYTAALKLDQRLWVLKDSGRPLKLEKQWVQEWLLKWATMGCLHLQPNLFSEPPVIVLSVRHLVYMILTR